MYTHTHTYRNAERGKRDDGNIKRMLIKEKRKKDGTCVCIETGSCTPTTHTKKRYYREPKDEEKQLQLDSMISQKHPPTKIANQKEKEPERESVVYMTVEPNRTGFHSSVSCQS